MEQLAAMRGWGGLFPLSTEASQSYILWRDKASNNTTILLPAGSALVLFGRDLGEGLDHTH